MEIILDAGCWSWTLIRWFQATMQREKMIMATFQSWLGDQLVRPDTDPVGWLARQWKSHEGSRPKVSSPTGIGRFLTEQAGEDANARGYVELAVKEATTAYRDRDAGPIVTRDGEPANAAAEALSTAPGYPADDPGMNPATGKPVAVVPSAAWVQHPDATQFGSCGACGWPRGLANLAGDVPAGVPRAVITCAAGHIFEPQRPENLAEVQDVKAALNVTTGSMTIDGEPAGQMELPLPPPLDAPAAEALASDQVQVPDDGYGTDDAVQQILVMQGMILHTLTRIARHVGLPPEQLDVAVDSAVELVEMTQGGPQMPVEPFSAPPFPPPSAQPGDLSSQLYGLAGAPQIPAHHPGNDPQAFASWFNAAEYGDPGNG